MKYIAVPSITWIKVEVKGTFWNAKIGTVEIRAMMYILVVVLALRRILNLDLALCRA